MAVETISKIIKRDGRIVDFDKEKITNAIFKAAKAVGGRDKELAARLADQVVKLLKERLKPGEIPTVEQVQDLVEKVLVENGHYRTAKAYILYRKERTLIREEKKRILQKEAIDEVDKKFSVNAIKILASRYLLKNEEGKLIESPKQLFQRVAALIVIPDILHDPKVFDKEGKQAVKPKEEFDPVSYEGKLGLGEIKWNRWHLERMKHLYDELNSQGKMKVKWSEFLKMLENKEFEGYYQNYLDYYELMVNKKFLPNSPTLFNAGARLGQLSACFVLNIEDDMRSIMEAVRDAALIFQSGGGIGINYSKLRPEGDVVTSTGGIASGPLSFARIIDVVTDVVKQGGCVSLNSYARTSDGIIPFSSFQIFNPKDEMPLPHSIFDGNSFNFVILGGLNGKAEVFRIETELGNWVDVTYNELVGVWTENGIEFREAWRINENDYLIVGLNGLNEKKVRLPPLKISHPNSNLVRVPKYITNSLARIIGLYMADGCWNNGRLILSFNKNENIEFWISEFEKVFGLLPGEVRERKGYVDVVWFSRDLERYFEKMGWKKISSSKAFIPLQILSSSKLLSAFLQGLFEGDGYVHGDGYPVLYTTSEELARQVQEALLSLGIVSKLRKREARKIPGHLGKNAMFTISIIEKESVRKFLEKIGFVNEEKNKKVERVLNKKFELQWKIPFVSKRLRKVYEKLKKGNKQTAKRFYRKTHKYMLNHRNLTFNALKKLSEEFPELKREFEDILQRKYYFARVVKKEKRKEETIHIEVIPSGTYLANGILLHNKRRGACMGILEISHPDIEKFITVKETPGMFENFNLSVLVFPDFIEAYEKDEMYALVNPRTKKAWKHVKARYLMDAIAMSAWRTGDPGVVFFDNLNKRNVLLKAKGPIRATNPCVTGDTYVLTRNGNVPIKELHNPQEIFCIDRKFHKISWVGKTGEKEVYLVKVRDGNRIKATIDHKFLTPAGWKPLSELKVNDKVIIYKNNSFFESSIEKIEKLGVEEVFDLKEPITHSFVANGFVVHNCGEEPLYEYESCNLGSINLYAHFKEDEMGNKEFDWEELKKTIRIATQFLDNVIDVNKFPLEKIEKATKASRKIGLGMMGLADTLFAMKIPYNSEEGFELMRRIAEFITFHAMLKSSELAKERGVFPLYEQSAYPDDLPIEGYYQKEIWTQDWNKVVEAIKANGIRNAEVTTIAPTGSLSMLCDVSSGIEPQYALVFEKVVTIGSFYYTDLEFQHQLKLNGLYEDYILKKIKENGGSVQGLKEIPEEMRRVFVTALDIPWWDHVRAQAEIGKWICAATSKTINMPNWVAPEDIKNAFLLAYKLGCKGITVYRDGSKAKQVLYSPPAEVRNRQKEVMRLIKNKTLEIMKKLGIEVPQFWNYEEEIPRGKLKKVEKNRCPECGSSRLVEESGCLKCLDCGWSVCTIA